MLPIVPAHAAVPNEPPVTNWGHSRGRATIRTHAMATEPLAVGRRKRQPRELLCSTWKNWKIELDPPGTPITCPQCLAVMAKVGNQA
jgi:hypothetical protein